MLSAGQDRDTAVLMFVYNGNCDLSIQDTFDYVQWYKYHTYIIWAATRGNLSSVFPTK